MELEEKFKEAIYQRPTLDGAQICVKIAEEFSIGFLNFVENSQFCLINNNYIDMKTDTNVDVKKILEIYKQYLKDNGKSRDI